MKTDVLIVGAGIVGLATALKLLERKPGLKITILEKEDGVARHQSGNNSGVLHSGIYYKPGSAKAVNCIRGYQLMLEFCRNQDIPFELCGKLIVATNEQELPLLESIRLRGIENGLANLKIIDSEGIRDIEPHVQGIRAIQVPQAGIVDYKQVAFRMAELLKEKGVSISTGQKVREIRDGMAVICENETFQSKLVLTCGGLYSDKLAYMTHPEIDFKILPFRGEYYTLKPEKSNYCNGLIYPVPDPAFPFLGVHFTKKVDGSVEAGPNAVLAFRREGYLNTDIHVGELWDAVSFRGFRKIAGRYWRKGLAEMKRSFSKRAFTVALQKLVPEIKEGDLISGGAGVRAQACDKNGVLLDDFLFIEGKGVIHVANAPSPAATSSLAIGETIAEKALKQLS